MGIKKVINKGLNYFRQGAGTVGVLVIGFILIGLICIGLLALPFNIYFGLTSLLLGITGFTIFTGYLHSIGY